MSLKSELIDAVKLVPVLHSEIGQFRIQSLVEKQLQHNRSGVMTRGVNPSEKFEWPYLSHSLMHYKIPHIKFQV